MRQVHRVAQRGRDCGVGRLGRITWGGRGSRGGAVAIAGIEVDNQLDLQVERIL